MQPRKRRGSYKPATVRTRVLAKKIAGKNDRAIAREEGIDRATVGRILSDSEYRDLVKAFRQDVVDLIPRAIKVYRIALDGLQAEPHKALDEKIAVLDGDELNHRLDTAYKSGVAAGLDAMKAATETLKGAQVFTSKEEIDVIHKDAVSDLTDEELEVEDARLDQELAGTAGSSKA